MRRANVVAIATAVTIGSLGASSALVWALTEPQTAPILPVTTAANPQADAVVHAVPDHEPSSPLQLDLSLVDLSRRPPWTSLTVAPGDSLSVLFERAEVPASDWMSLLKLDGEVNALRQLHPGDVIRIRKTADGHLAALEYRLDPLKTLHVERSGGQFESSVVKAPTTIRLVRAAGRIQHSLLSAVQRAGASPKIAANLARIFHWRVDLSRSIHKGDPFVLIYRQVYADGQLVKSGPILAAKLKTDNQTLTAFRFAAQHGDSNYYDQNGRSLKPSLLRTPLHYTRVSSPFSLRRYHPLLHTWRPHYGVDLAAPMGTPIKAAANGHVKFVGHDGGYGRLIILENFGPYSTRYGHLSRFADDLHKGDFVHQGQVIGYVGQSGAATGPHLHFEIRVNGVPKPPLKVALPDGAPIPSTEMVAYQHTITPILAQLKSAPPSGHTVLVERYVPAANGDQGHLNIASLNPAILGISPEAR